jgi:hypothetical protein
MLAAIAIGGMSPVRLDGLGMGCRGIIQSPVHMHLLLHRIMHTQCVMVHLILVKSTSIGISVLRLQSRFVSDCISSSRLLS